MLTRVLRFYQNFFSVIKVLCNRAHIFILKILHGSLQSYRSAMPAPQEESSS